MDLGLEGQAVVITGAARGIGAEAARAFAREGARVAVWDRDADKAAEVVEQIRHAGGTAMPLTGSVGETAEVRAAIAQAREAFGGIHVLINNAGFGDDAPLIQMSDAQWDRVLNVCLTGPFLTAREVAPTMIAQQYGRIINVASRAHLGEIHKANYCAAKAGVLGLSRALAIELGPHGITVNTINPGIVRTERVLAQPGYDGLNERAQQRQLVKRPGEPGDIVNGMLFYASATSGFVTGDVMYVSGGRLS